MEKKRLDYFDMAKGIGVFLVLIGHLQGDEFFSFSPYVLPMCEWIFSFHMALFFIISGMLLFHKRDLEKDTKTLIQKKFKGIMIPYYWFSFFYMCVVFYAFFSKAVFVQSVYLNLWYVLGLYGMNVLWFLPALFLGEILFIFINKKLSSKASIFTIVFLGAIGLTVSWYMAGLSFDTEISKRIHEFVSVLMRPLVVETFIAIGFYGQKLIEKIDCLPVNHKAAVFKNKMVSFATGAVLMIIGACFVSVNHGVDFRSLVFKNVFFYYLCSLTSSFGLILICKSIKSIKLIKFWGINSLIFMGVHNSKTVLFYGMQLAMYINQFITRARGYICYGVIVLVILIYVSIMIVLINKFVPFIAGKPYKKSVIDKKQLI